MDLKRVQKLDFEDEKVKVGVERGVWHGGPFTVVRYKYEPGAIFPPHSHESSQLTVVLQGTIDFFIGNEKFPVSAGETIYIPSNETHGAEVPKGGESVLSLNIFHPPRQEHP